ncbi:hypothetical protein BLS_004206 [Venturia inaequalis]|uniref:Uncharacterized protein n=1 Tax=Venturia inaequalis TaxID=5025 RepID=A0A8H3UM93_VENIN|nr:hypothetical protein BLS_004206 [Venturia inaequalis]KAE9989428.1 hypothetical protein EG327_002697 [Venturia inaequalis]
MASLPPLSPSGRAVQEKTPSIAARQIDPVFWEQDNADQMVGQDQDQYPQGTSQPNENQYDFNGTQGLPIHGEPWDNLCNEATHGSQSMDHSPQPFKGNAAFDAFLDEMVSDIDSFSPMASQQPWDKQQGFASPGPHSQTNWQNHGSQVYDDDFRQPLQSEHGYDNRLPLGSYPDSQYNSQQIVLTPQYPMVNDQGHIGSHGRHDSGHNARQQQYVPQMSSGNWDHYAAPRLGAQHAIRSQQTMAMGANDMHQQFRQPSWNGYQQPQTNEHRPASLLGAPQPYLYRAINPQQYANHPQQATKPSFNALAPQSYQDGLQQLQQGPVDTGRPQASSRRSSRESTVETQSVPPQVFIPPDCPIGNLTNYSLDFLRPPQKVIKKALDEHWIDYPGVVQEFFTSPFPEYSLTPENPNDFLPAKIHIKTLSPAQMLEYHARAPQHRDLMHKFIVPRMIGYPNELPDDTPAIKQKKFKNNTISMRQQRLREQNGQFMGDAKISRVAKKEKHKSLTKVFMEVLPKTNGASLLHGTIGRIMKATDGCWFTRTSFTGGGLDGDHDFPLRQPMAIPQPLADELKKAGLPEPDLHEHLRQNEEMWQLFYPQYFNNGKQMPPIEENRRQTHFVKGRGGKAAAPGPARGTKRQRTAEPTIQQTSEMSTGFQATSMPPPPQQQQQTLGNMQSRGTQQFLANIHSSRNRLRMERQTDSQASHFPSTTQHGEDDHNSRVKKRRTGPGGYNEEKDSSMGTSATADRGSLLQHLNHHNRGNPSIRTHVPIHVDNHQQRIQTQQRGQVAQMVNPGWDHIVGTAISDERVRQAQAEATVANHDFRREDPVDVPSQQEQSLVDDGQWADLSSSPFTPAGDFQGQSPDLSSGAIDEKSSSADHFGDFSSPIRYDLMAMPRVPIGGAQWQPELSGSPMLHGAVDLRANDGVQHISSSPPATARAEVEFSAEEPQIPQLPSSPPKTGLNDSGYFPGGLAEGNDGGSGPVSQAQGHGFVIGRNDIDLSQVSDFNFFHSQEENSQPAFSATAEASRRMPQDRDGEFNPIGLSQVSQFNAHSQGGIAVNPENQAQAPDFVGDDYDFRALAEPTLTPEFLSQSESPVVQLDGSHLQEQETDRAASPQCSANVCPTAEPVFIDLSEDDSESSQPDTSVGDRLLAEMLGSFSEDGDGSSKREARPRKSSWSQLNDHASAHRAQLGDNIFESCDQCQEHREAMGTWGAEKTKKKVKGEAIGYGRMTEVARAELHMKMLRRAGLTKKVMNREILEGL